MRIQYSQGMQQYSRKLYRTAGHSGREVFRLMSPGQGAGGIAGNALREIDFRVTRVLAMLLDGGITA